MKHLYNTTSVQYLNNTMAALKTYFNTERSGPFFDWLLKTLLKINKKAKTRPFTYSKTGYKKCPKMSMFLFLVSVIQMITVLQQTTY